MLAFHNYQSAFERTFPFVIPLLFYHNKFHQIRA
ncbi:MAG: hypothetical protein ACLU9Y_17910 [Thomasclavelia ramosa]